VSGSNAELGQLPPGGPQSSDEGEALRLAQAAKQLVVASLLCSGDVDGEHAEP
jgi:hypothetical protein